MAPWLLTCEHAGNRIPKRFAKLFAAHRELLKTHRGWDPGTLALGKHLQSKLKCPLVVTEISRLLIETNRSLHHPSLFSAITRPLPKSLRDELIQEYYLPHHQEVERQIDSLKKKFGKVLHIGVHSFTPVMDGVERNADIGLLYDPRRPWEREFCSRWKKAILELDGSLQVRMNYPYRGASDGLTKSMRQKHSDEIYAGIELEVNQRWPIHAGSPWKKIMELLATSLILLETQAFQ